MDFKLMLVLSALGMTCGASIQDPYIHDSAEDQIAMESGPVQTVVMAPPHLQAAASEPLPTEVLADQQITEPEVATNELTEPDTETKKQSTPFTVLVNDEPIESVVEAAPQPAAQPAPVRPSFSAFAVRRPALSPLMQMSLLSRLQPQLQLGGALGGFGGSPVILLQPIIVPVPVAARDAEQRPNSLADSVMSSLVLRRAPRPRPLSLMDILQRGYYGF
ncbi:uncharacterized protein LOC122390510 [Amphibalanus amphitrite]|uniref:uncharacterized protein LOC122366702 n=1 Tax=Amphibalanus amphitrite TaxID=1232801 RepID=UPI001C909694|nr:uncharacterized protein LOC122366702 [Amphibalanus amphitrite]XP_043239467.1 uncharacterized protein LOC122390510 [Amphibalanus amphitrite]